MSDFISRYTKLLSKITDAPKIFIEASAICLVSTFAGRKCFFMSAIDDRLFNRQQAEPQGEKPQRLVYCNWKIPNFKEVDGHS